MSPRQTVQNSLTASEIFELGATLMQVMPRNLDSGKVRADLKNKSALGRDLGKFFRDRYAAQATFADASAWIDFYRRIFGEEVDLTGVSVPPKPEGAYRPIVIAPGITNNYAFAACKKCFDAWRWTDDFNGVRDIVKRPSGPYVVWVKDLVEADPDLAKVSAEEIEKRGLNTLTLLERLVLELKYFDETKKHLDIDNWTLCAGSRYTDGHVPHVYWHPSPRKLYVHWCYVDNAYSALRARAAVTA